MQRLTRLQNSFLRLLRPNRRLLLKSSLPNIDRLVILVADKPLLFPILFLYPPCIERLAWALFSTTRHRGSIFPAGAF